MPSSMLTIGRFRNRGSAGPFTTELVATPGFWHNPAHGMEGLAAILGIILPGIM